MQFLCQKLQHHFENLKIFCNSFLWVMVHTMSLRTIVDSIGEDTLFEGLDLAADDWEEMEEYEYAFV